MSSIFFVNILNISTLGGRVFYKALLSLTFLKQGY